MSSMWGSVRTLRPAGRVAVLAVVVVYWGVAGFVGWSLAWSDDPGPPRPAARGLIVPGELEPLFDEPVGWGGSGWPGVWNYDVGDDGQVVFDLLLVDEELPDTVPPRLRAITNEQRHERDLAFAAGEEALARWESEAGLDRQHVALPRTPAIIDLEVACFRLVVSAYDLSAPDPEGVEEVEALLDQRLQEVHANFADVCQHAGWSEDG